MKKQKLDDLYFGVCTVDFNSKQIRSWNLFDNLRIKWSVACYVTMSEQERKSLTDPFRFCFGDVWGRVEYEMIVGDMFGDIKDMQKTDVYSLFCEPNRAYLMSLVDSVSENSAKTYMREERKRLKQYR